MKNILKAVALVTFLCAFAYLGFGEVLAQSGGGTITQLDPWVSTSSPVSAITQRTANKGIKITGLTTGLCLTLDSNNVVTTTSCGSGGGGGISSLNGLTGATQTFATGTATGIGLNIVSSGTSHTFTPTVLPGYVIPLTASTTNWNTFYNTPSNRITAGTGLSWSGNTLNDISQLFSTTSINGFSTTSFSFLTGTAGTDFTIATSTTAVTFNIPTASASNRGALSTTDWSIFNNKVSTTRAINVTSPITGGGDLSADRTIGCQTASGSQAGCLSAADWTTFNGKGAGSVTSVAATVPTGLTIGGSPITTSGALAFSLTSGYVIPLVASTTQWASAYASTSALSGTSPVTYNASTGAIGCATCLTSNQTITLSGDVSGSGSTAITTAIGSGKVTSGMLASGVFANPSGTVGLTAVNGSAGTAMRSDGAPALSQSITPTWTGTHTFSNSLAAVFTGKVGVGSSTPSYPFVVASSTNNAYNMSYNTNTVATTTLYVGGSLPGQIVVKDQNNSTCTVITTAAGVISGAAITCPTQ